MLWLCSYSQPWRVTKEVTTSRPGAIKPNRERNLFKGTDKTNKIMDNVSSEQAEFL